MLNAMLTSVSTGNARRAESVSWKGEQMGLRDLFGLLFGRKQKVLDVATARAAGRGPASRKAVALISPSHEIRRFLAERLKPAVEALGFEYIDEPDFDDAVGAMVIILDGQPATDARLHSRYDKILRIKKAMRKADDIICVFGPREFYRKYPRGTYSKVLYFCLEKGGPDARHPDLSPAGRETIEGPTLFNFADLPVTLPQRIEWLSRPKFRL